MNTEDFESLSPEEQEKIFHQTSFKEKGDLVMHSHDPKRLVRSLSQEELYLTAKEMDIEERGEILRFANLPQLFFVSDVDCWKGDRLDSRGFVRWLETLYEASPQTLLAWLVEMDYETVTAAFKKIISVLKPRHEYASDEVLGDRPHFSLDDSYFISVEEDNLRTVKQALEVLFENHRGKYAAIIEGVMADLDDELEEEAYQRRELRLEERGFPAPEMAKRIYRTITPAERDQYSNKEKETKGGLSTVKVEGFDRMPLYPVKWSEEKLFLDEVLLHFRGEDSQIAEGIQEELAWLSNKVIACDGIDFSNENRVRKGIQRARWFVNLGLEILTDRNPQQAAKVMKQTWLEAIFRTAVTDMVAARQIAERLVETYWNGNRMAFLDFISPPYEFIFRGLLQIVPQCFDGREQNDLNHLRDFRDTKDLAATRAAVNQIVSIHEILRKKYNIRPDTNGPLQTQSPSLNPLLGTLFARHVLDREIRLKPLTEPEIRKFVKQGFEPRDKVQILRGNLKTQFIREFLTQTEYETLKSLMGILFDVIDDEFARLSPNGDFDPRLIHTLYAANNKKVTLS